MQRRTFLLTLAGGLASAMPAFAAFSDDIIVQLTHQGYQDISVSTTWLGRVRILAKRDGGMREIVLNPRTGEILRDLWTGLDGSVKTVSIVDDVQKDGQGASSKDGSGSGSSDGTSGKGASGSDGGSGSGSDGGSGGSDDGGSSGGSGSGSGGSSGGTGSGGSDDGGSDDGGSGGSAGGDTGGSGDDGGSTSGSGGAGGGDDAGGTDDDGTGTGSGTVTDLLRRGRDDKRDDDKREDGGLFR